MSAEGNYLFQNEIEIIKNYLDNKFNTKFQYLNTSSVLGNELSFLSSRAYIKLKVDKFKTLDNDLITIFMVESLGLSKKNYQLEQELNRLFKLKEFI
jgi:hypothetical protein